MSRGRNDYRRLKDEANIGAVVDYCGIKKGRKVGSAQFVICPNPAHNDEHPTNAYYRDGWNGIYCTTCGKKFWAIDVIMWSLGMSYGDAADALWTLEGSPSWYYAEDDGKKVKKQFSLSYNEMEFLGLHFSSVISTPMRLLKKREFIPEELERGCKYNYTKDGYLLTQSQHIDWGDFVSHDGMKELVLNRCAELENQMDNIEQQLGSQNLFESERSKIDELRERARDRSLE